MIKKSATQTFSPGSNENIETCEYIDYHNDMNCYKYDESLYEAFINAFSYLPICPINYLPKKSFEANILLSDLVWSDPQNSSHCVFGRNPQGLGCLFNLDALNDFL